MTQSAPVAPGALHRRFSEALLHARDTRTPIAPLTDSDPGLTIGDAYAIARIGIAADLAAGARPVGHKIGLTAVAVQRQLGVDQPDYGALLDTMAIADGATIDAGDYIAPRIEVELAFRLGSALPGPEVTADDVRAATEAVHPSFELVDSRIADWKITLVDTIADRASSGGYVIGDAAAGVDELDLTAVAVELERNGEVVHTGRSDAVLGDPCVAVAWLANAVSLLGEPLQAGEVVLSGAITAMLSLAAGDSYRARFGSGLGELTLAVAR
jgi:2-keto-4-pentenoate hydratase